MSIPLSKSDNNNDSINGYAFQKRKSDKSKIFSALGMVHLLKEIDYEFTFKKSQRKANKRGCQCFTIIQIYLPNHNLLFDFETVKTELIKTKSGKIKKRTSQSETREIQRIVLELLREELKKCGYAFDLITNKGNKYRRIKNCRYEGKQPFSEKYLENVYGKQQYDLLEKLFENSDNCVIHDSYSVSFIRNLFNKDNCIKDDTKTKEIIEVDRFDSLLQKDATINPNFK